MSLSLQPTSLCLYVGKEEGACGPFHTAVATAAMGTSSLPPVSVVLQEGGGGGQGGDGGGGGEEQEPGVQGGHQGGRQEGHLQCAHAVAKVTTGLLSPDCAP